MDSNLRFRVRSEYGRGRRLAHHLGSDFGWMWIPFPSSSAEVGHLRSARLPANPPAAVWWMQVDFYRGSGTIRRASISYAVFCLKKKNSRFSRRACPVDLVTID